MASVGSASNRRSLGPDPRPAITLLADLAREHEGQLRVLALGPLTNLARLAIDHPETIDTIAKVIVMGGAFARKGNVTAIAEANIHNDPEAARIVFDAPWSLDVIPLDITMQHALTEADADVIGRIPGAIPTHLVGMLGTYLDFYMEVYGIRQCAMHDPLAAIIAADGMTVVRSIDADAIRVVIDDADRGRTVADIDPDADGPSRVRRIILEVQGSAVDVLIGRISQHAWPE